MHPNFLKVLGFEIFNSKDLPSFMLTFIGIGTFSESSRTQNRFNIRFFLTPKIIILMIKLNE